MIEKDDNVKKRAEYLDIAKGIGILLVVWAHAKGPFSAYIYQFHMPLFFLISGYLFNERNTVKQFIVKKVQTLYIPFVFWNIIFTIVEQILQISHFSRKEFGSTIIKILLTISKSGSFLGATWFLGSLFVVSVVYKIVDRYLPQTREKSLILLLMSTVISYIGFSVTFPYMISRTMVLTVFFAVGRVVRDYREKLTLYETFVMTLFSIAVFVLIGKYNSANMGANEYRYRLLFVIGALAASYIVIEISKYIEIHLKYLKKIFCFWGRKSMPIVIWQFVVFRVVIALQLNLDGISLRHILDYYPCYRTENGWWIIYILVGMYMSILIGEITGFVKNCIIKVINIVRH